MKLRNPIENKMKSKNRDEFEDILKLNDLLKLDSFKEIGTKTEKIGETIIDEILGTNQNPKKYKRSLKRRKQQWKLRIKGFKTRNINKINLKEIDLDQLIEKNI